MINFENVSKAFGDTLVVKDLNFTIEDGELFVLIGLSGCGKTTTLRMINRLEEPSSGKIIVNGKDISGEEVIALRRNMGYVIQQTGLFPHYSVEENITMIPFLEGVAPEERKALAKKWMDMVGMPYDSYGKRYPGELSGGQSQRVGVARALATDPEIILMDEPFSALDPITRGDLQEELVRLHDETGKTIVFVTHDMDEAIKIADKICIMQDGEILQLDTPEEILRHPANDFVRTFVGESRIWSNPDYILVRDLMNPAPVEMDGNRKCKEALILAEHMDLQSVMIIDEETGEFYGAVSRYELEKEENREKTLFEVGEKPWVTLSMDNTLPEVMHHFTERKLAYAPVVDDSRHLVGLLTRQRLLLRLNEQYEGSED